MSISKHPSHIRLPPQQNPSDVFSQANASALSTTPLTPSAPSTPSSPAGGSPFGGGTGSRSRAGGHQDYLTPNTRQDGSISGTGSKSRRATFLDASSPTSQHPPSSNARRARTSFSRNSFASSTARYPKDRRASRVGTIGRRVSQAVDGLAGDGNGEGKDDGEVKIPTLALGIRPAYSTPLPLLPMVVLSIAMMSELLSANLCTPFLLQMVESFFVPVGQDPTSEQASSVGLWTGNLVSVFYITQFLTSLLWSGIADRHGRRLVLIASLLGSAIAVVTFGTSGSLPEAIAIRLVQGVFGGSIGVVRGSIRDITDSTNETRAYALLSFAWSAGGTLGPILGGVLESPARKFPTIAGNISLLSNFPYLLPTLIAGLILSCGALLATGLSWDAGPRRKKIVLPIEKDEPLAPHAIELSRPSSPTPGGNATPAASIRKKASSVFLSENVAAVVEESPADIARVLAQRDLEAQERARRASRNSIGAAAGYGGIRVKREFMAQQAAAARRESSATARPDDIGKDGEHESEEHRTLAERFLIANEQNNFNLNELWVSAAIALDTSVFDEDGDEFDEDSQAESDGGDGKNVHERTGSTLRTPASKPDGRSPSVSPAAAMGDERSPLLEHGDPMRKSRLLGVGHPTSDHPRTTSVNRISGNFAGRRFSTTSGMMPAIFANTGLRTPPAIAAAYDVDPMSDDRAEHRPTVPGPSYGFRRLSAIEPIVEGVASGVKNPGLSVIQESANGSQVVVPEAQAADGDAELTGWRSLPLLIILSSAALALHDTVHGQIFLSFIFTPYSGGGLGLEPADFSVLVAVMCGVQLYLQFVAYPRLPPRGGLSHLQMFRLGTVCFIPAYLTLPMLRAFVTPGKSGGPVVMTLVTLNMAIRYTGGTFGYTSIMILINAMSPPKSVGLANGLSQSLVSLSRFIGPVVGGAIWSGAIRGNPDGYYFPFWVVTAVCLVQLGLTYLIR